ncbi:MAG: InlB B-repeat-containing protein [Aliidiomarina sp.]|uniref:InlB B-repeat-containing protein n=1 Tax=Aliidiomarina sp. TaxID=1872439 RepID=UPI0025C146C1|nr:InlB B-repeat-containing protein [Aliidiomarina sp.]MCH8502366.1 InlB B-repeat-containing protein [Aliidiomarina sp.]
MNFIRSAFHSAQITLLLVFISLFTTSTLASPNESGLIQQGTAFELGDDLNTFREATQMRESPDGRFVYVLQLSSSQLLVFERDATTGALSYRSRTDLSYLDFANEMLMLAEGRLIAFPGYSFNRIDFYFRDEETGALTFAETKPLVSALNWGATKSPDERFFYFTRPFSTGISVYEFQENPLSFTWVSDHSGPDIGLPGFLNAPRNFTHVSADGLRFLIAGRNTQSISVYDIDAVTGQLSNREDYATPDVNPISIMFSPDERHLYIGSDGSGTGESSLHIYDVDSVTGTLNNFRTVNVADVNLRAINSLTQTPDGKFVFVGSALTSADAGVVWFERDPTTGDLTFKLDIKNGVDDISGVAPIWSLMASADNKNWYAASGNGNISGLSRFFTFQLGSIVLDLPESHLNFIPNTPVQLAENVSIDVEIPDNTDTVDAALVRISGGFELGDMLSVTAGFGVSAAYDSSTGELSLSGAATAAEYVAVLQTLALTALGDVNDSREVTIEVSSTTVTSNTVTVTLTLPEFTVRFLDWDGTVLAQETVQYGNGATAPVDPTRDNHEFAGWDVGFAVVTSDLDVTAQYDINTFTVRFLDWDGSVLTMQTVDWNTAATAPADPTRDGYTFIGWNVAFDVITADLDVSAQYNINTFTVRFLDWDDSVIATETVNWNEGATAPADPERDGHTFIGWSVAFDVITANLDVTAQYDINTFTVRFLDWDDSVIATESVNWNEAATAPTNPTRELYEFIGWDRAFDAVTSDLDVTAQYERNAFVVTATVLTVDGFGVVTPMVQQVPRGGTATFEAWTSRRYTIRSVQSDCGSAVERSGRTYEFDDIRQDCEVVFEYRKVRSSIVTFLKMHGAVIQTQDDEMPENF